MVLSFFFGTEAYFVKNRKEGDNGELDSTNSHIILLAKNEKGRRAINLILSQANIDGFYYQPRIDLELILSLPKNDVWITTACLAGVWKYNDYEDIIVKLHEHFGENLFLEIQAHLTDKQKNVNIKALNLSNKYGIKLIAGVDSHYIDNSNRWERDEFLSSKGLSYLDEEEWFMDYPDGNTLFHRFFKAGRITRGRNFRSN